MPDEIDRNSGGIDSPTIVLAAALTAALTGALPPRTGLRRLLVVARHLDWDDQAHALRRD